MVRILSVSVALTMGAGAGGAAASHASAMTVPASGAGTDDQRYQGEGNALMDVGDARQGAGDHAAAARAYGKAFAAFAQRSKSDAKETQAVSLAVDEFKLAQDADPKNLALLEEEAKLLERFMAHPKRKGELPEGLEEELARVRTRIGELKGKEAERKEAERKEAAAKAAVANEPATEVGPSVDEDDGAAQMPPVAEKPSWIRRWAPTRNVVEVALVVGVYVPGKNHELYEPTFDLPDQGFRTYKPGPELGVRVSYLPLRFLAIELEGVAIPTRTSNDAKATIWTVRSGLLAQLPHWTVAPFAVVGGGALGVVSERSAVGNDADFGMYFGGGLKTHFGRRIQVRWDIRDVVSYKRGEANSFGNHNFESLLALVVMFDVAAVRP